MEIKITTNHILIVLQIISWIIFSWLMVEAGAIIVNTFITLFINPSGVKNFWEEAGYITSLYQFNKSHFIVLTVTMIIVAVLKALLFYLIVKLLAENKLNMAQPFNKELSRFMVKIAYLSFGIGLFSRCGYNFTRWLSSQMGQTADLQLLHMSGHDVWLFMAIILFVIVQIVKRGIEIQRENDLTI